MVSVQLKVGVCEIVLTFMSTILEVVADGDAARSVYMGISASPACSFVLGSKPLRSLRS